MVERKLGDWVRVRCIRYTDGRPLTHLPGLDKPCWGELVDADLIGIEEFNYAISLICDLSGPWGVDAADIIPEDEISDAAWAELAEWRLIHG